jgi:hypothetical protein
MFFLGAVIILGWVFCFFYYGDMIPQNVSVAMIIGGLFTMGWGLLTGKR